MDNETENLNSPNEEATADAETTSEDTTEDVAALKAKAEELESANRQLFERAKKAEGFVKVDGKWVKASKPEPEARPEPKATGELDETALDYLDLKGITEEEDIKVIETVRRNTGKTLREALKDDYVVSKLEANKANRARLAATPSATKRSGGSQSNDLELAMAKFEATGKLPDDFALRAKVVEAKEAKEGTNVPSWRR